MPKLKSLIQFAGLRGRPRHYSYEVRGYDLGDGREVRVAYWKHPIMKVRPVEAGMVEGYREYIKEGDFCVDIGAHVGDTTLPMGIAAGTTGCVLALEPNPYVYHVLEKTCRANKHLANIRTIMAAAAPEEGFIEFEYSDPGFCNGGRHEGISALKHGHAFKQEVFAVNVERELRSDFAELLPRLTYIKIDAEGFDLHVLGSIQGIIEEFRPVVQSEVWKNTSEEYRHHLLAFFQERDYTVRKVIGAPAVAGEPLTEDNLRSKKNYDIVAIPN